MLIDPVEIYKQINLFEKENEMKLTVKKPGTSHYIMEIKEKHLSSPNTCHGGVIAGLMDVTIGSAALFLAMEQKKAVSTVEFKINYYSPVHFGDVLEGIGEVDFEGNRIIYSTGVIRNTTRDNRVVAKAIGTFNKYPLDKKDFSELFVKDKE